MQGFCCPSWMERCQGQKVAQKSSSLMNGKFKERKRWWKWNKQECSAMLIHHNLICPRILHQPPPPLRKKLSHAWRRLARRCEKVEALTRREKCFLCLNDFSHLLAPCWWKRGRWMIIKLEIHQMLARMCTITLGTLISHKIARKKPEMATCVH